MKLNKVFLSNYFDIKKKGQSQADEGPVFFKIPHYQRPYVWGQIRKEMKLEDHPITKIIDDWYNDVGMATDGKPSKYFAGAIVAINEETNDEFTLIDGQQRCTTFFLLNFIRYQIWKKYVLIKLVNIEPNDDPLKSIDSSYIDDLIHSHSFVFKKNESDKFLNILNEIKTHKKETEDFSDDEAVRKTQRLVRDFTNHCGIKVDEESFDLENRMEKLRAFLANRDFNICYAREAHKIELIRALSFCDFKFSIHHGYNLEFDFQAHKEIEEIKQKIAKEEKSFQANVFLNAITIIVDYFKEKAKSKKQKSHQTAIWTAREIESYLKSIELCVVSTPKEEDAYTLFEVLNDRGIALDDLDLVKNLHYKKYALNSEKELEDNYSETSNLVTENIEQMENLWGEVFQNVPNFKKNVISYSTISYITGNHTLGKGKGQVLRKALEKALQEVDYNAERFKKDFQVYKDCHSIIIKSDLKHKNKEIDALTTLGNLEASVIKIVIHLLWALKLDGVLYSLMNCINHFLQNFDANLREKIVEALMERKAKFPKELANEVIEKFKNLKPELEKIAARIGKYVLWAKDYQKPKEYAAQLIKEYAIFKNTEISSTKFSIEIDANECKEWLNQWDYRYQPNQKFKVRFLFILLLLSNKSQDEIIFEWNSLLPISVSSELMELDHFEPQKIRADNSSEYFNPKTETSEDRDFYVNCLGNMLPLDQKNNKDKTNRIPHKFLANPAKSFEHLTQHWLFSEIKALFEKNSTASETDRKIQIPTEKFFVERKRSLIKDMLKVSDLEKVFRNY